MVKLKRAVSFRTKKGIIRKIKGEWCYKVQTFNDKGEVWKVFDDIEEVKNFFLKIGN